MHKASVDDFRNRWSSCHLRRAGYTCSCGIAHNKLLAKLACGLHKPDQQTALPAAQAADLIAPLPVRVLGGVGHKTARLLAGLAVHTVVRTRPSHSRVASEPARCCPRPLHAVLLSTSLPRLSQSEHCSGAASCRVYPNALANNAWESRHTPRRDQWRDQYDQRTS